MAYLAAVALSALGGIIIPPLIIALWAHPKENQ